jgi:diadenosine tetraphosphatase ApaH/serine/threonine PP2A family protein phosphatase
MRIAVIADVRANEQALIAVLARIAQLQVDRIWCIGSLLSHGPDPAAVVDRIRSSPVGDRCFVGYPDTDILSDGALQNFNTEARRSFTWARQRLRPKWWSKSATKRRWVWLKSRPAFAVDGEWQLFSCSPECPYSGFLPIFANLVDKEPLKPHFTIVRRGAFVGTISWPGIVFDDDLTWNPTKGTDQQIAVAGRKFIACPGAVGQPRDGDPRACFAIFDGETITWHRVEYDIKETVKRISVVAELPDRYAQRLEQGR